jgi:hypothetical protein
MKIIRGISVPQDTVGGVGGQVKRVERSETPLKTTTIC